MPKEDDARNEDWRILLYRIAVLHRVVPDQIEIRISCDSEGGPRYALYIDGKKISDTNACSMMVRM